MKDQHPFLSGHVDDRLGLDALIWIREIATKDLVAYGLTAEKIQERAMAFLKENGLA